jgi:hypothetical protein
MAEKYVQLALEKLGADTPTTQSILRISVDIAQAVNKSKDLKGAEKMALVQQTLRALLATPALKEKLSEDATTQINTVINDVVPPTITLVIEAGRGHYDFKKPSVSCFVGLLSLLCRTVGTVRVETPTPVSSPEAPEPVPAPAPEGAATPAPAPPTELDTTPADIEPVLEKK